MVVTKKGTGVLSILLFLFGVNSVHCTYLLCSVFSALQQNASKVSVLSFACIVVLLW